MTQRSRQMPRMKTGKVGLKNNVKRRWESRATAVFTPLSTSPHYEVRHEVLIPLASLASFLELKRADPGFLDTQEQDVATEKIKAFFSSGNPVQIDGVVVQPTFDRIDFYGLDLRDFAVQAERRKISMANGRVGVIMSYSTKGMPASVSVT